MNDPGLNSILKWSVQNSADPQSAEGTGSDAARGLNPEALAQLFGGPSDADRMRMAMTAIKSPDVDLENKITAFDNLEQLIENLDNANNMESLGLWTPLVEELDNDEEELRRMAAWCIGTAVQNNQRSQERCLVLGTVPKLSQIAQNSNNSKALRKKALFALSSEIRNYQPALNELLKSLPSNLASDEKVDAGDMDAVDSLMARLRESIQ